MSRSIPHADRWSRQNATDKRLAAIERSVPVIPSGSGFAQGPLSTSLTGANVLAGSPQAQAMIGASGDCRLHVSAELTTPSAGQASIYLGGSRTAGPLALGGAWVDSFTPQLFLRLNISSGVAIGNVAATRTFSGWFGTEQLAPGQWIFTLAFGAAPGGTPANFVGVYVEAIPI